MLHRIFCLLLPLLGLTQASNQLIRITEENWQNMLQGEWMVEFHAPWCPACKDLQKSWRAFADWSQDLSIKVGEVDVTVSPGLSGRFLVTSLPSIYHVKDGVFRYYGGPRAKDDLIDFVENRKWTVVDPMPKWKRPDTIQMGLLSAFFRFSASIRQLHSRLTEQAGLPSWASYLVFGLVTLLLGCILGCLIVMLIDCVFPADQPDADKKSKQKKSAEAKMNGAGGIKGESSSDTPSADKNGKVPQEKKKTK